MDPQTLKKTHPDHFEMAAAIRVLAMDAVEKSQSGHPGMPMGMADIATVLWSKHLKFDASAPDWPDRDRFMLSNGHGSMLLYALLYLTGFEDMTLDELKNFRQLNSRTPGHPELHFAKGIETTTGPLGQGLANSVGFALAEESLRARYGKKVVDHHTYVFAGDGCLMEGISHEAIGLAGMQRLGRLIVFFDANKISIDGDVALADLTDQPKRFEAADWHVQEIDGHDPEIIDAAITAAKADPRPSMIRCATNIGWGAPQKQDTAKAHGSPLGEDEIQAVREAYGWIHGPFEIPQELRSRWSQIGARGADARRAWEERFDSLSQSRRNDLNRIFAAAPPRRLTATIRALKKQASENQHKLATRKASEMVLEVVNPIMPEIVGGSADLTGSNNTLTADLGVFNRDNRKGRYIHYGVREHGMAAAMNGMAIHGGIRPYGGTFLTFTDYARGAIRLSAMMEAPVVYVMTHDSIGLGEDGPTHQPVEHLSICRATPNLRTFRPADTVETAEAWELALTCKNTPSVLALSRQGLSTVRTEHKTRNLTAQGAYVLADSVGRRRAIIMATGSEVEIAMAARKLLQAEGVGARVVSMPCMELFAEQDEAYRRRVLPGGPVRVAVEAGVRLPWDQWLLGERGRERKAGFVGMTGFGASAPAKELYAHFGITAEAVADKVRALL